MEVYMNHAETDVFKAIGIKEEDYTKLKECIANSTNKTLNGVGDVITQLDLPDKQKLFSYYISNIMDIGIAEAMTDLADKLIVIESDNLDSIQQCFIRTINMFTIASLANAKLSIAMAIVMNAIVFLALGPTVSFSTIVEIIHNGMSVNKISYHEMLKGTMVLLSLFNPENTEERVLQ
jgi:hypothetical protein